MRQGDHVRAESNGGWLRIQGKFISENEIEVLLDVGGELRALKKSLFFFGQTDVNGVLQKKRIDEGDVNSVQI